MRLLHILLLVLLVGCGPGIRYRPGEIPAPTTTNLNDIQAGHQLHAQMIAHNPILRDPVQEKRVAKILQKLLDATPTTGHWTATLVDSPVFNAMTAPGNFIYVYRGLLQTLPDDELAAVLAHEIAHRLAQHEVESSEETLGRAISVLATIAAGAAMASQQGATQRDVANVMDATNKLGQGFTTLRYSRDKEREADQIGMFLLADAGINPAAFPSFWARKAAISGSGGSDFLSTHPIDSDRYTMSIQLLPLAQERYERALKGQKSKKKAKRAAPPSPDLLYQISQAEEALQENDLHTASTIAQSLTSQAPSSPETYNLLGRVKLLFGEEKQASKAFKKGLTLAPEDPILIYNMGCTQARQGKTNEALASLEKAFTLHPTLTSHAAEDPDLVSLYENLEFKALLTKQYVALPPAEVGGNTVRVN
jgi:predicted Zn-dependent protease